MNRSLPLVWISTGRRVSHVNQIGLISLQAFGVGNPSLPAASESIQDEHIVWTLPGQGISQRSIFTSCDARAWPTMLSVSTSCSI